MWGFQNLFSYFWLLLSVILEFFKFLKAILIPIDVLPSLWSNLAMNLLLILLDIKTLVES